MSSRRLRSKMRRYRQRSPWTMLLEQHIETLERSGPELYQCEPTWDTGRNTRELPAWFAFNRRWLWPIVGSTCHGTGLLREIQHWSYVSFIVLWLGACWRHELGIRRQGTWRSCPLVGSTNTLGYKTVPPGEQVGRLMKVPLLHRGVKEPAVRVKLSLQYMRHFYTS